MDRVVPCTLELVACDRHGGELLVGDLDSGRVVPLVELGVDLEALFCRRVRDQLDDDPVGGERAAAPVHCDEAEEPVLDLYLHPRGQDPYVERALTSSTCR